MDKIVMNSVEKQVFSQICLGNVIRKTLINVIIERNICSVPTLDRTLKKFQRCGLVGKEKRGKYPLTQSGLKEKEHRETKPTVTFDNSGLAKVISKLPTEAHRGLIYFILATIVAKKYLAEKLGDKGVWGNFIDIYDYYLRRAFTVNSANLPCDQKENEIIGADIANNPIPKLKIDGLVVVREEGLTLDEKAFVRNLLYDRWITDEAKEIVDSSLLDAVILGMLILKKSVDVRYYSYWAVLHYLCFLDTLGYTKGAWREELPQEWGDYVVGSGGDEKFKKAWEEQAEKVKEEKAKIEKVKGKVKSVVVDKDAVERVVLAKYTPKIDRLKEIKTFLRRWTAINSIQSYFILIWT